jgi:hypothetical protein
MADFVRRAEWEAKLGTEVSKILGPKYQELIAYLGDPPDLGGVPAGFWAGMGEELRPAVEKSLVQIALESARAMMAEASIGVDWALVNKAAVEWARKYTYELVKGITDNTMTALQEAISGYFENQGTMGDLVKGLEGLFSELRANTIAVTEVTRASVMGELSMVNLIEEESKIRMTAIWQTNNDELVCPICGDYDQKKDGDGWTIDTDGPPAHPNCRCWLDYEFSS